MIPRFVKIPKAVDKILNCVGPLELQLFIPTSARTEKLYINRNVNIYQMFMVNFSLFSLLASVTTAIMHVTSYIDFPQNQELSNPVKVYLASL